MFLIDKEVAEILIQLYILQQKKTMCQPSSRQTKEKTHLMHSRDPGNHGKTVGFFLKISKEIGKAWRVLRARSP